MVLNLVNEYLTSGKSVQLVTRDIFQFIRDVLVVKMSGGGKTLTMTKEMQKRVESISEGVDSNFLMRALEVFTELEPKFKFAASPRILLEASLLKLTNYKNDVSVFAMNKKIVELERIIARGFPHTNDKMGITNNSSQGSVAKTASGREPSTGGSVSKNANSSDEDSHIGKNEIIEPIKKDIEQKVAVVPLDSNLKGRILRELRVDYNPSLFALVNYSLINVDKSSLILTVSSNLNKEYIMQSENHNQISSIGKSLGYENVVIKVQAVVKDESEDVVANLKKLVGDMLDVK